VEIDLHPRDRMSRAVPRRATRFARNLMGPSSGSTPPTCPAQNHRSPAKSDEGQEMRSTSRSVATPTRSQTKYSISEIPKGLSAYGPNPRAPWSNRPGTPGERGCVHEPLVETYQTGYHADIWRGQQVGRHHWIETPRLAPLHLIKPCCQDFRNGQACLNSCRCSPEKSGPMQ
jgi:hypothetical protein